MKKLHEYETPLTDVNAGFSVTDRGLNYTTELYVKRDSDAPFVHANFARDLERKLALAMDMLSKLTIDGIAEYEMREAMHTGIYVGGGLFREAVKTLEVLREIENENNK